ncbi:MAG TPA: Flp pilus assembly protein CpaB [Acidimicrobiales bacterium]|nr:Flp pilus assembly protein CpaB [Acidimicrobiales bacterium]
MRGRRSVIVAVALVLGLVAGGAAYAFLHSVQTRAYNGARLTDVYQVEAPIGRGTAGAVAVSNGLIKKTQIPEKFRPTGTITDLATIQTEVATNDIAPGQILVGGLFGTTVATGGSAAQVIPKGDVAITVSVDQVHGVAGLVQPGDQVDVLVDIANNAETYLYENVPVLAVGTTVAGRQPSASTVSQTTPNAPAPTASSNLVTFAVSPDAAARIALAQSSGGGVNGSLYLALVPPGNSPELAPPAITSSNLIPVNRIAG